MRPEPQNVDLVSNCAVRPRRRACAHLRRRPARTRCCRQKLGRLPPTRQRRKHAPPTERRQGGRTLLLRQLTGQCRLCPRHRVRQRNPLRAQHVPNRLRTRVQRMGQTSGRWTRSAARLHRGYCRQRVPLRTLRRGTLPLSRRLQRGCRGRRHLQSDHYCARRYSSVHWRRHGRVVRIHGLPRHVRLSRAHVGLRRLVRVVVPLFGHLQRRHRLFHVGNHLRRPLHQPLLQSRDRVHPRHSALQRAAVLHAPAPSHHVRWSDYRSAAGSDHGHSHHPPAAYLCVSASALHVLRLALCAQNLLAVRHHLPRHDARATCALQFLSALARVSYDPTDIGGHVVHLWCDAVASAASAHGSRQVCGTYINFIQGNARAAGRTDCTYRVLFTVDSVARQ